MAKYSSHDAVIFSHEDWGLTCLTMCHESQLYVVTGGADEQVRVWAAVPGKVCNSTIPVPITYSHL